MRILGLFAVAALGGIAAAQPPKVEPPPMPMPPPKAIPTKPPAKDLPHLIFVGRWEMVQYQRPNPELTPILRGYLEFREDRSFTWTMQDGEKMRGTFSVRDQHILLARETPLGERFEYFLNHLDIKDGKVIRPIGKNVYEEWTRVPPGTNRLPAPKENVVPVPAKDGSTLPPPPPTMPKESGIPQPMPPKIDGVPKPMPMPMPDN